MDFEPLKMFEECYSINKNGDIISEKRKGTCGGLVKKQLHKSGYLYVNLNDKNYTLHRLLGLQFIPKPEDKNKNVIDHIDRCRTNNKLSNLRWVTPKENANNINPKGYIKETKDEVGGKIYMGWRVHKYVNRIGYTKRFKKYEDAIEFYNNNEIPIKKEIFPRMIQGNLRYVVYYDEDNKKHRKSFKTEEEAKMFINDK